MIYKTKISIRFFDDREVRAVWDEENAKWWFSVVDVIGILNDEADYTKNRNYWKYLRYHMIFKKCENLLKKDYFCFPKLKQVQDERFSPCQFTKNNEKSHYC